MRQGHELISKDRIVFKSASVSGCTLTSVEENAIGSQVVEDFDALTSAFLQPAELSSISTSAPKDKIEVVYRKPTLFNIVNYDISKTYTSSSGADVQLEYHRYSATKGSNISIEVGRSWPSSYEDRSNSVSLLCGKDTQNRTYADLDVVVELADFQQATLRVVITDPATIWLKFGGSVGPESAKELDEFLDLPVDWEAVQRGEYDQNIANQIKDKVRSMIFPENAR